MHSSLTTPEPTPLCGAPGTFGAPFAQNDSAYASGVLFSRNDSVAYLLVIGEADGRRGAMETKRRFFAHHPRTYPIELTLYGAPGAFGDPVRSATVWIVKGGLVEKRKTMVQFPAFPQPRLRLLAG